MNKYRFLILALALGIAAVPVFAAPDEQVSLRSVANIARLALGCDPATSDPQGAGWVLDKPPATYFDGGSPNQKMLVRVWHYGWALRVNSPELSTARSTLLDFINRQQQFTGASGTPYGHYATLLGANEELTSSHYQLWAASLAAAYLYAIANGGTVNANSPNTTPETGIRDASRKWWSDEKALYDRIYTNNQLDAPGARFPNSNFFGTNVLRDDIYRLLRNLAPVKVRTCTADKYYTSSFVLQALRNLGISALGNPPSGYTPSPKLYDTLCVYRYGSDWTLYFPVMRSVSDPLYWVEFRNGLKFYAGLPPNAIGKPQSYPFGATLDQITGVVAGAATCPSPQTLNQ
jgi:hypothetical protein